ncbi:MAG TPA: COX15/CtaA family protein [Acidimicrobiia bacterium]|nr:COX15/CtaA family protein [Acidimicrobiia bacterium]
MPAPSVRLTRYAWFTLGFTVLVILLGAVVRATGSGAGCGANWPTCNGGVLPLSGTAEEAVEFTHRATSGLSLLFVAALYVAVRRTFSSSTPVRKMAFLSGLFILTEALIGAGLVLFEWVADDTSVARAVSVGLHLVNTFLLLGALGLTAWWLRGGTVPASPVSTVHRRPFAIGAGLLLLVGAMGAITALGDTLFPAESLVEGLRDDFSAAEHFLVRLRWIHPILAIGTGWYLAGLGRSRSMTGSPAARRLGTMVVAVVVAQIVAGVVNVLLLAPLWMQVVHLLLADTLWIFFIVFAAESIGARQTADLEAAAA